MGSYTVVSKGDFISMQTGVRHKTRLYEIASVVEPIDILLADVEF